MCKEEGRGKQRKGLGRVFQKRGIGATVTADKVCTVTGNFDDFVRTTSAIGKLSNGTKGGITINLNPSHDQIANSEGNGGATFVGVLVMDGATPFSQHTEYLFGKLSCRANKAEKGMDISSLVQSWGRCRTEA